MAEYYLDERSRGNIQRVVAHDRAQGGQAEWTPPGSVSAAPTFYCAALAEGEHLPAFDGTQPGQKECEIYKIVLIDLGGTLELEQIEEAKMEVWNFYRLPIIGTALESRYYFAVTRTKFGGWVCERPCALVAKNLGADVAGGSSGTATIYKGTPGAEMSAGVTVSFFNRTGLTWATGKFGGVDLINGLVYGFPWECPPSE